MATRCVRRLGFVLALALVCGAAVAADEQMSKSAILEQYAARKKALPPKSTEAQFALAQWCEEHGLSSKAKHHYRGVVQIDPSHEGANAKLGNELVDTPKGKMWLSPRQKRACQKEAEDLDMPKGEALRAKFLRKWRKRVPLRVRMKCRQADPAKAKRQGPHGVRLRKKLVTSVSLTNKSVYVIECQGAKVAARRKWSQEHESNLLWTVTDGGGWLKTWPTSFGFGVPFSITGRYGYSLSLKYVLQVSRETESRKKVLRLVDANRIRKALDISLAPDTRGRERSSRRRQRD